MRKWHVGVAIPTMNSGSTLATAIASVREQMGGEASIVVADSGSTDGTLDLCHALGVHTVYVPPGNMYRAINEGLRRLDATWLAYLNSDDFVYTDAYARLVSAGESDGADVVYGHGDYVDAHGRFLYSLNAPTPAGLRPLFAWGLLGFLPHGAVFRRSVFEELGGFDEDYRHIADLDFFARASATGRRLFRVSCQPVAAFRLHAKQISRVGRQDVRRELDRWSGRRLLGKPWSLLPWKARNIRQYALRWLRTGALRGY